MPKSHSQRLLRLVETPDFEPRPGRCRAQGTCRADPPTLPGHVWSAEDPGRTGRGGPSHRSQAHRPIDARARGARGMRPPPPLHHRSQSAAGSPPTWSSVCFRSPGRISCGSLISNYIPTRSGFRQQRQRRLRRLLPAGRPLRRSCPRQTARPGQRGLPVPAGFRPRDSDAQAHFVEMNGQNPGRSHHDPGVLPSCCLLPVCERPRLNCR